MKPNLISNGEVLAGKYLSHSGYQFGDGTYYGTALIHYISCFDLTTQTGSTTIPNPFIFGTTDIAKGFSVESNGTHLTRVTASHAGVYNFIWSGQFENSGSGAEDIFVWFRINGQDVIGSTGLAAVPGNHAGTNGHALIGWNFFLTLNAGDYAEIMWMKTTNAINLPFYSGTANYPSTASIVLTVNQIA